MEMIINSPKYGHFKVLISAKDKKLYEKYRWHIVKSAQTFYVRTNVTLSKCNYSVIYFHNLIMGNPPRDKFVDHIDRNGLNNRRSNLRLATYAQSNRNRETKTYTVNKYKGVMKDNKNQNKKYRARLIFNRKVIYGGYFETMEEAAVAYNKMAIKYHGDFACLNEV